MVEKSATVIHLPSDRSRLRKPKISMTEQHDGVKLAFPPNFTITTLQVLSDRVILECGDICMEIQMKNESRN